MSSTDTAGSKSNALDSKLIEQVLIRGDLGRLTEEQRVSYYNAVCETVGLNPLTKPFEYITLNGKLVLYANKGCAEQLRSIHKISIRITSRDTVEGVYIVTSAAQGIDGRVDESTGAVQISGLKGDNLANAMMKAETKSKRRVTLSICGLNMLDDTEVETIVKASPVVAPEQPGPEDGFQVNEGYMIDFGQWNRRSLEQVYRDSGPKKIAEYIEYIERESVKKGVAVSGKAKVFVEQAELFLGAMENQAIKQGDEDL